MVKITVITPVYNGVNFIDFCLQNVIKQKCSEAEHLIVDGGSTDGTLDVVKQYANEYSHIRWFSEPDEGQSDAMNKGIRFAKGEIIGYLNVDDYYEPNVLNQVLKIFASLPNSKPTIAVGNSIIHNMDGTTFLNKPGKLTYLDLLLGDSLNQYPYNSSQYFYHKSLHEKIGEYDKNNHFFMDADFILRAVKEARVIYIDQIWGHFVQHVNSKTVQDLSTNKEGSLGGENLLKNHVMALNPGMKIIFFSKKITAIVLLKFKYIFNISSIRKYIRIIFNL